MLLLKTSDEGFEAKFTKVVRDRRESDTQVGRDVSAILHEVRERGDKALVEYTTRFDGHNLSTEDDWSISKESCEDAYKALDADLRKALEIAAERIRAYHVGQLPEAVGDYIAGPNHVLPTGRRARFASGLSVLDFMKRTSFIGASEGALEAIGPAAVRLAEAEGLPAHALSISKRLS